MDTVRVKVCGITRAVDAERAASLGASALGFIFWPQSPRYIEPSRARDIISALPPHVAAIGVFVDQPREYVEAVANLVRLAAVQLHGRESVDYAQALTCRVIKAIPMASDRPLLGVDDLPPQVTVLLDAHDPIQKGGTGRQVDWASAAMIARRRRVILSGGLRPDNVAEAIAVVRPYAVDVSSGVEHRPGVKDAARLRAFFEVVRQATTCEQP